VARLCLPVVWGAASQVRVGAAEDPVRPRRRLRVEVGMLADMPEGLDAQHDMPGDGGDTVWALSTPVSG